MKKILSLFFVFALIISAHAQINTMQFTQTSGVYTEIAGDTTVALATGTTGAASLDDVAYGTNALPFTFTFNGTGYTSFSLTTNGFITFGTTLPSGSSYVPISATTAYSGAVGALGNDMQGCYGVRGSATLGATQITGVQRFAGVIVGKIITGTGIPVGTTVVSFNSGAGTIDISAPTTAASTNAVFQIASGSIVRGTTGTAGSRVHTIQWKNFRRFGGTDTLENTNFQIKLYEATGNMEVVYGSWTGAISNRTCQVGLRGATNTDFNNRTTTTNWAATTAGGTNAASCTWNSTVFPASGQTYRWSAPLANDVGTPAVTFPGNPILVDGGSLAPKATIRNFGGASQTTPFNITCTISPGGYSSTISDTLAAGYSKEVTFANSFVPVIGNTYTITVYTQLGTDQNRANDTARSVVQTISKNFGSDSGYAYANSNATNQPSFPNYCWKDTSGSTNLVLNAVTQPGAVNVGGLDDGYFKLNLKNILLAYGQDTTGKSIKFNGVCWDSVFINTNGIIGLTEKYGTYSINDFNVDGGQVANNAILACWKDFNFGSIVSSGRNRLSYKVSGNQLIITYDRVQCFAPTTDFATFQVVLEINNTCADPNANWRVSFADSLRGTSGSLIANYLAQTTAATGSATTYRNWIMGWTGTGLANAYAGFISSGNPFPAAPVTQVNVQRPVFNADGSPVAIEFGPSNSNLNTHDCMVLNLKLALEGLQSNSTPRARDTVTIYLRDGSAAPYTILETKKVFLDSATTYKGVITFESGVAKVNSNQYYIVVQHRNSIRSWSNLVSQTGGAINYDFTTGVAQTFGSNAVVVNGLASFFTGDVTQDGTVDASDASLVDNDAFNFVGGDYVVTDLNWDGIVDASDASLADNNAANFVGEVAPPGAAMISGNGTFKYDYVRPTQIVVTPDPTMIGIIKNESDAIYPNEKK
jgi:hypothetical protein